MRNLLAGLLLALVISLGWIVNFLITPAVSFQQLLFIPTPPSDPAYSTIVINPIMYMDLALSTFLYPLVGIAASFPHLFSPGNVKWVRRKLGGAPSPSKVTSAPQSPTTPVIASIKN